MAERQEWLDAARAAACVSVVALHVAAQVLLTPEVASSAAWSVANAVSALSRFGVPVFFMISGALFLSGRPPRVRHFIRLVCALTFYSAIALAFMAAVGFRDVWVRLALSPVKPVFYHLWFFYALFGVYALFCVVSLRAPTGPLAWPALGAALTLLNPSLRDLVAATFGVNWQLPRFTLAGETVTFLLYAAVGAMIAGLPSVAGLARRARLAGGTAIWIGAACCAAWLTARETAGAGQFVRTFHSQGTVLVAIGSTGLFLAMRDVQLGGGVLSGAVRFLSAHCLPIYGLHPLPLWLINKNFEETLLSSPAALPAVFAATIGVTCLMALPLRKLDRAGWVT